MDRVGPRSAELDAYQLVTQAVESPLAKVCEANYTSLAKIRKQWLPERSGPLSDVRQRRRAAASPPAADYGRGCSTSRSRCTASPSAPRATGPCVANQFGTSSTRSS